MTEQAVQSFVGGSPQVDGGDPRDSERRILLAAVELVDRYGETGLRISDLVEASGRSVGSIYHFFDNREGVIEAVRAYRFYPTWDEDIAVFRRVSSAAVSLDDWLDRLVNVESIAAARTRPSLRTVLAGRQGEQSEAFEGMLIDLVERGIARPDLELHSTAVFMQGFTLGRILSILDGTGGLSKDDWLATARRAMDGILRP